MKSQPRTPEWFTPITPREKQWEAHEIVSNYIRAKENGGRPAYVYASVGFGKTILLGMIAKQAQIRAEQKNIKPWNILVMARTGDLVDQNSEKMWDMGARNSVFSSSLKLTKDPRYPVVVGSEGTIYRRLMTQLKNYVFDIFLIDECYQVPYEKIDSQCMIIISELIKRNPNIKIIGYGGSRYRGTTPILGSFWKEELFSCSMWESIEIGYCCPLVFGFPSIESEYKNLDQIKPSGIDGTDDLSQEQMREQSKIITQQKITTHKILEEVKEIMKTRHCALITCAGNVHIKQCIEVLPEGSYAIVTEETKALERKKIKDLCNNGKLKYVLQIGAWTVGVNVPMFDTCVILRRIGSITLLEQLTGRTIRWLEEWQEKLGFFKKDALVLDYAGTFESMAEFFNDELIEAAQFEKSKRKEELIYCPRCNTENSKFARRCRGTEGDRLEKDGRCGFFWSSKVCPKCQTENDKVARSCRCCDETLVDPNANLTGKHYVDADFKEVLNFETFLTKNSEGIIFKYTLPDEETATEIFYPKSDNINMKRMWYAFMCQHVHKAWHGDFRGKSAASILKLKAKISVPAKITHRLNDKQRSIINRKVFLGGREESIK